MRRITKIVGLPALGLSLLLGGFIYDVLFAGIPYQDPTPELEAQYDLHSRIAGLFYGSGGMVLLLGLIAIPVIWKKTNEKGAGLVE